MAPVGDKRIGVNRTEARCRVVARRSAVSCYSEHTVIARSDIMKYSSTAGTVLGIAELVKPDICVSLALAGILHYKRHKPGKRRRGCRRTAYNIIVSICVNEICIMACCTKGNIGDITIPSRDAGRCLPGGFAVY